jgi:mannosylglycerate hydrolase
MDTKRQVTIVSHTHWDRAWYVTFQEFRVRLVRLVDRLLDLLASQPDFKVFTLDGQMAVLEDYLEVRPQRQAELQRLCRERRLRVGPWYVLADEFLVSPEALIRNMQLGHRMGETYGGVAKLGYVPDGFGHIAQLPQILRGFGIDNAFFWRGLGDEGEQLGTEFQWQAPDGSAVTAIWMPWGYHNISNLGYPIHWGDTSQMVFDEELAFEQLEKAIAKLVPMGHTNYLLLMNGIDHEEAEPRVPEILTKAGQHLPQYIFQQGTLDDHLNKVRASTVKLPVYSGEFRWGKFSEILQGVYATRIYLKQRNHQVETLLERYAEPLSALAWAMKACVPDGTQDLLWTGWKWLLKNHPHDDIYGSGIDKVHEEMLYRFDQAEQIGEIITRDSLRQIARQIDLTAQSGTPLLAFNPLGQARAEMVTADIDFEIDDPAVNGFQLVDIDGKVIPYQVTGEEEVFWMETLKANRKHRVHAIFPVEVPATGFTTLFAQPMRQSTPTPIAVDWQINENGAENRYLSFIIDANGGLTVKDKTTQAVYPGLNHFEDVEDAGDEYTFSPCEHSETFSTSDLQAEVIREITGVNAVTFAVRQIISIPESLTEDRKHRATRKVDLSIISHITLYRDQPGIFIRTEVENHARDHKLSVVFPTGLNPQQSFVDSAFAVVARDIDLPNSVGWVEDPTPLMHQRTFTDINDGTRGLAVLNRGLPAVEVFRKENEARVSLVLLRCVGWLSRDDCIVRRVAAGPLVPTPGAQCPGHFVFEYAVLTHAGGWNYAFSAAQMYNAPIMVVRGDTHEGLQLKEMNITRDDPNSIRSVPFPREGRFPGRFSGFEICSSRLALSSLHRSQDGRSLIARLYNISDQTVSAKIRSGLDVEQAWKINLNEEMLEALPVLEDQSIEVNVRGAEIITLMLVIKHE